MLSNRSDIESRFTPGCSRPPLTTGSSTRRPSPAGERLSQRILDHLGEGSTRPGSERLGIGEKRVIEPHRRSHASKHIDSIDMSSRPAQAQELREGRWALAGQRVRARIACRHDPSMARSGGSAAPSSARPASTRPVW